MARARNMREQVRRFYCPYCQRRLWYAVSPKYYLFFLEVLEQQDAESSHINALFLASHYQYDHVSSQLEKFICSEHGQLWMKVTTDNDGTLVTTLTSNRS